MNDIYVACAGVSAVQAEKPAINVEPGLERFILLKGII